MSPQPASRFFEDVSAYPLAPHHDTREIFPTSETFRTLLKRRWRSLYCQARAKKVAFSLSFEHLEEMWALQEGLCYYTRRPLLIGEKVDPMARFHGRWDESLWSLTRLSTAVGYREGNLVWVCLLVNRLKGLMSDQEFRELCSLVASSGAQ